MSRHPAPIATLPPFSRSAFRPRRSAAFSLAEMMVSMAASVIILGALILSAMSLRRGLHSNETYTTAYSDQRRLTDYVGRDLRRAVGVAMTDEAGARSEIGDEPTVVTIDERASLVLTLPAYYRSNTRSDAEYDDALDIVGGQQRLDYGTSEEGLAPTVEVSFRKMFYAKEKCVCFVRQEAGIDEVIVRNAENLRIQVTVDAGGQTSGVKIWYRSTQLGPAPLVSTYDRLLLRNPPLTYQP